MKHTYLLVRFYLLHDILLQKPNLLKQNSSMNTPELKDELENKGQNVYFQVNVTRISNSLNLIYRLFPQKFFPLHQGKTTIYKTILCIYIVCVNGIESTIY